MLDKPYFLVSEDVVVWAFRFCLTRSSHAQQDGIDMVTEFWDSLSPLSQARIRAEIERTFGLSFFSTEGLLPGWKEILNLKVKPI